ncbi:hypothetical protein BaRGS_00035678, partial [Batillaria attramentaria]
MATDAIFCSTKTRIGTGAEDGQFPQPSIMESGWPQVVVTRGGGPVHHCGGGRGPISALRP